MELILEKLIPIVGSKGWKTPNIENAKYVHDITNFKNGKPSIILLPQINSGSYKNYANM